MGNGVLTRISLAAFQRAAFLFSRPEDGGGGQNRWLCRSSICPRKIFVIFQTSPNAMIGRRAGCYLTQIACNQGGRILSVLRPRARPQHALYTADRNLNGNQRTDHRTASLGGAGRSTQNSNR